MIVVIPMAGAGQRFMEKGYTFPKALVTIRNKPMVQWVVENLQAPWATHIFVVNPEDYARYDLSGMVSQMTPKWAIGLQTERKGAAHAVVQGLEGQDLSEPLLIANCDQWLQWDATRFWRVALQSHVHGLIPVFPSTHPKWSYVRVEEHQVVEVAEKHPISGWATCGLYYWKTAQMFVDSARSMMLDDQKQIGGEWYVAPTYNELIAAGGTVYAYPEVTMWGLGTPEDLEEFKMAVCSGRLT